MPVILPPEEMQIRFGDAVSPIIENANANIEATAALTQLCDTLLPKLISGNLRVANAEAFLKERSL
ncbi:hypothetical protein TAO_1415 [Candidatus Nitrosoglobus terrae]|uniref:Type I restriction modification DNA specificity domain-containing protein n=1 Tax=Candidatus Nitrosoglobus terrae TaxID=1630141 RepID=A0A1Q2SNQ6_9GAMM|nr:hypothetical protein [Candidatus Nitrosoglobus terrae]BAW80785.1 hypothetical protein TAO_1415 [Candidatus Nitrosoglobus terrae]